MGNDALPSLDPRDSNDRAYFRDLSSLVVDEITRLALTEFASIPWFYTGQSHPLFASATEKSIARFRDAIFSNASSSFARSLLSVTGHSYAIIFRGCSVRPVNGLSPMEGRASFHSRRSREEEERVARDPRLRNLLHRRDLRSSELFTGTTDERILAS